MITKLKPYPAYKDSGVEWLGQVPGHWEIVPLRRMASGFNNGTSVEQITRGTTAFPVSRIETISTGTINYDKVGFIREENVDSRFWLDPGDILLSHINSFEMVGNCAQFLGERPLLHGMNLIRIRPKNIAVGAFMFRFMKSAAFRYEMRALCKPAINQVSVTTTAIKGIHMPLPPLPEQTAIVRFLDWAERRIRRLIRARKRRIKLLEEYKQALIHQAVTGQIDVRNGKPYPAYKDSGVEWLGQVPAHWGLFPFKRYFTTAMGQTILASDLQENGEYPVFSATEGSGYFGRMSSPRFILHSGDLVIPARGVSIGSVKLVSEPCVCTQTTIYAKRIQGVNIQSKHVFYFLRGCRQWLFEYDRTAIPQLTVDQVRNNPLLVPPLPEQTAIVEYLDTQTAKIDTAMAADRRAIELLQEFRTRLIADVVTGKVDVREVAAQLPEEAEELEAVDEAEALPEDEAAEEGLDEDALAEEVES